MSHPLAKAAVALLSVIVLAPAPARAGSVWDPDEPGHRLDIRWVGAYQQLDGRMRVTMSFYDRTRIRWFDEGIPISHFDANVKVGFTDVRGSSPYWFVMFMRNQHDWLSAWLCESGSSCYGPFHVHRVDRDTIRARISSPSFGPAPGWYFRAFSFARDSLARIDYTRWARLT
jgi:hypothetical protein